MISDERLKRFVCSGFLLAPFSLLACSTGGGEGSVPSASSVRPVASPITWVLKNPMPTPRTEFGVATVNDKIYAIGGYSGSVLRTVEEYDPATDTWARKADMSTPRRQLIVVSVNNKIYAIGGVNFSSDPNGLIYSYATEEYNPATNTWAAKASMPTGGTVNHVLGNRFIGGAVANGKIYIAAHNNPGTLSPITHALEYDPATNVWTSKTQPPFRYTRYTVASLNNKVYALSDVGEMAEYDPLRDNWIIQPPLSTPRFRTGLAPIGGKLFSIGGGRNSSPVDIVEEYDPETKNWTLRASMASPRVSVAVGAALGKLYAIGGSSNASAIFPSPLTTVEEGTPTVD